MKSKWKIIIVVVAVAVLGIGVYASTVYKIGRASCRERV